MMKKNLYSFIAVLMFCATAEVFAQTSQTAQTQTRTSSATGTRVLTNQRDVTAYMEELSGTMVSHLKHVQDENAALEARIVNLEQRNAELESTNKALRTELSTMKTQVSALTASNASCEKMLKNISAQLDKIASMSGSGARSASSGPSPIDAGGSYAVYEVQAGATLSAIASAYGVTVNEIKRANNLKSDKLSIGQKLKIPAK